MGRLGGVPSLYIASHTCLEVRRTSGLSRGGGNRRPSVSAQALHHLTAAFAEVLGRVQVLVVERVIGAVGGRAWMIHRAVGASHLRDRIAQIRISPTA